MNSTLYTYKATLAWDDVEGEDTADKGDGSAIETGQWRGIVTARRLVSDEQRMALVLTPPCPVVIDQDVTRTGPISCTPHALHPVAVDILTDGVTLDCDDQSISGAVGDAAATRDNAVSANVIEGDWSPAIQANRKRVGSNTTPSSARIRINPFAVSSASCDKEAPSEHSLRAATWEHTLMCLEVDGKPGRGRTPQWRVLLPP